MHTICPRCHFRLAPSAHICRTCGHSFHSKKESAPAPVVDQQKPANKQGFWNNVFSLNTQKESVHDEPALGET